MNAEIPINEQGVVYHIKSKPEYISNKIILVGDPDRVNFVSHFFDSNSLEWKYENREIKTMTGKYKGERVTVLSTGMGTDNIEIIINELHILKEYNFKTSRWNNNFNPKDVILIRVGTCGSPQEIPVGSLAITKFAIGLDNTCRYYTNISTNNSMKDFMEISELREIVNQTPLGELGAYASKADSIITEILIKKADICAPNRLKQVGITASASGFFACQGRAIGRFEQRMRFPNLINILANVKFTNEENNLKVTNYIINLEMETSALCFLSSLLGYRAGSICAVVSNRSGDRKCFLPPNEIEATVQDAVLIALETVISS